MTSRTGLIQNTMKCPSHPYIHGPNATQTIATFMNSTVAYSYTMYAIYNQCKSITCIWDTEKSMKEAIICLIQLCHVSDISLFSASNVALKKKHLFSFG